MKDVPRKCRAAILDAYGRPLNIKDVDIPEIEPGGILVKVEMAGICGTDVHLQKGELSMKPPLPIIPGHETIGRIVDIGSGRSRDVAAEPLEIGDRILWAHIDCGECYGCEILRDSATCTKRQFYGYFHPSQLGGGFAEYEYIKPATKVVKVPETLRNEEAIGVGCAFRTAVGGFERFGGIGFQETVVIQGAGPVGLYSALIASENATGQVIVIGAPKGRLELARKWGADHTIDIDEIRDPKERKEIIYGLTNNRGPEVVVECSGALSAFVEGLDMLQKGGRYLVMGQTSTRAIPVVPGLITGKSLSVLGASGASIPHYYKALQFIETRREKYPFADIVTHKFKLDEINEALEVMESGSAIKPVIE